MFTKILVPVDLSDPEHFSDAVKVATGFAREHGAKLRVMTVMAPVAGMMSEYIPAGTRERLIDDAKTKLGLLAAETGLGEHVSTMVREGAVYHEVLDEAEDWGADLIVMGSHRPAMATYLIGSNAARIVRHAPCSVLVIR